MAQIRAHNRTTISIANNALNIPEDIIQKLFDPFFTKLGMQ